MELKHHEVPEELFDDKPAFRMYLKEQGITMYSVVMTDCIRQVVELRVA